MILSLCNFKTTDMILIFLVALESSLRLLLFYYNIDIWWMPFKISRILTKTLLYVSCIFCAALKTINLS